MPLLSFKGHLTPDLCHKHPLSVFLFGDNLIRQGYAGQANIRTCPNAFGIPTKRAPNNQFFDDETPEDLQALVTAILMVKILARGLDVVVPVNPDGTISLGCGLAELPARAPQLYQLICKHLKPEGEFYA